MGLNRKCEHCGKEWILKNKSYRKNKINIVLCRKCLVKFLTKNKKLGRKEVPKTHIICKNCGKNKKVRVRKKMEKFCSHKCHGEYEHKIKYGHLEQAFHNNSNEVSYLFGLILGDGNLRKNQRQNDTTGIIVAFDKKYTDLIKTAKHVLSKLGINYSTEKERKNCVPIYFNLPDVLLKKYRMLWNGNKYDNNPKPKKEIINNTNFAAGLFNSDGCSYVNNRGNKEMEMNSTVKSIAKCCSDCLKYNGIKHKIYNYSRGVDKRTGKIYKDYWSIRIIREEDVDNFMKNVKFKMKDFKIRKSSKVKDGKDYSNDALFMNVASSIEQVSRKEDEFEKEYEAKYSEQQEYEKPSEKEMKGLEAEVKKNNPDFTLLWATKKKEN